MSNYVNYKSQLVDLEDYEFRYTPSFSIKMREAALNFRIACFGIMLNGQMMSLTFQNKFIFNHGFMGLRNNIPEFLNSIETIKKITR